MRIRIEIDDTSGRTVIDTAEPERDDTSSAPAELLARAAAIGARSAGPAPTAPPEAAPPPFTPDPTTTADVADASMQPSAGDQTAGAAPGADANP